MAEGQKRISITPAKSKHTEASRILVFDVVKHLSQQFNILGTKTGVIDDEHVAPAFTSKRYIFLNYSPIQQQCELRQLTQLEFIKR